MKITIDIPSQKIADLMVTVMEGNYMTKAWCHGIYLNLSDPMVLSSPWYSNPALYEKSFELEIVEILDESKMLSEDNLKRHICGSAAFVNAFRLMVEHSPRAFADFMNDNYDSITADVFIQYVALGEVMYG